MRGLIKSWLATSGLVWPSAARRGDLGLLTGQQIERQGGPLADRFSRGQEFPAGPFGKPTSPDSIPRGIFR